jgi:hypothetical protein
VGEKYLAFLKEHEAKPVGRHRRQQWLHSGNVLRALVVETQHREAEFITIWRWCVVGYTEKCPSRARNGVVGNSSCLVGFSPAIGRSLLARLSDLRQVADVRYWEICDLTFELTFSELRRRKNRGSRRSVAMSSNGTSGPE